MTVTPINFSTPSIDLSQVDITGGNINGTTIGQDFPAEAVFTDLTLTNVNPLLAYIGSNFSANVNGGVTLTENRLLGGEARPGVSVTLTNPRSGQFFVQENMFDGEYNSAMRFRSEADASTLIEWAEPFTQGTGIVAVSFVPNSIPDTVTLRYRISGVWTELETINSGSENLSFCVWDILFSGTQNIDALEIKLRSETLDPRITQIEYFSSRGSGTHFSSPLSSSLVDQFSYIPSLTISDSSEQLSTRIGQGEISLNDVGAFYGKEGKLYGGFDLGKSLIVGDVSRNCILFGDINFEPVPTAAVDCAASNNFRSSLRLRQGIEPATPNEGDIWFDGQSIKAHILTENLSLASVKDVQDYTGTSFNRVRYGLVCSAISGENFFNISAGEAVFYDNHTDPLNPQLIKLSLIDTVVPIPSILLNSSFTYVGIQSDGTLVYRTSAPGINDLENTIWLGFLTSNDSGSTIDNSGATLVNQSEINQLALAIGIINVNNTTVEPVAGTLKLNQPEVTLYSTGRNWGESIANRNQPNVSIVPARSSVNFSYLDRTGAVVIPSNSDIVPSSWDNGSGTLQTVAGDDATVQRVFLSASGSLVILLGQTRYNNLTQAIQRFSAETIIKPVVLNGFIQIATLIVRNGATNLSDQNFCRILPAGKFGTSSSGSNASLDSGLNQTGKIDGSLSSIIYSDQYLSLLWNSQFRQVTVIFNSGQGWTVPCYNIHKIDGTPSGSTSASANRRGSGGQITGGFDTELYMTKTGVRFSNFDLEDFGSNVTLTISDSDFSQVPSYSLNYFSGGTDNVSYSLKVIN